jgi:hypothetical protein
MNHCKSMNLGASRGVTPAPNVGPSLFDLLYSTYWRQALSGCFASHGERRSRIRASLRDQLLGSPSMGLGRWSGTIWLASWLRVGGRYKSQSKLTPSIVPRGTSIRRRRNSRLLIVRPEASASGQAAAGAASLVQRNSVPSTPPWPFAWSFPRSKLNKSALGVEFTSQT